MTFTMRRGAIALIDVLGFKGIGERYQPEAVIQSLQALVEASQDDTRKATDGAATTIDFISSIALSDTVVFGLCAKSVEAANAALEARGEAELFTFDAQSLDSWTIWHMGNFLAHLMRRALTGEVPFAFRGAVAFGSFGMTDRYLIGEAVDEAAMFHERPDGAIVGLAPSAARFEQAQVPSAVSKFIKYQIPTKEKTGGPGTPWDTWAVLPWGELDEPTLDLIDLFTRTIVTDNPEMAAEVSRKRENTLAFLGAASDAALAPMRAIQERMARDMAQLASDLRKQETNQG